MGVRLLVIRELDCEIETSNGHEALTSGALLSNPTTATTETDTQWLSLHN